MTDNERDKERNTDRDIGRNPSNSGRGQPDSEVGIPGDNSEQSTSNSDGSGRAVSSANTRDLLSARPFYRGAKLWRDKGWIGTIPLPAKSKNPPPIGWTGRSADFPDNSQINAWAKLAQYRRGNIGLHLGWPVHLGKGPCGNAGGNSSGDSELDQCPQCYEIIGIDVDNYEDGNKNKTGFTQLSSLENQLGPLPRTYVSTARASRGDYKSGIRFFLVPRGMAFGGQADADIEIIQKNHRFAVVWPSYNPKSDSQYELYSPDEWAKEGSPTREIPFAHELPLLPKKWLEYLTKGNMLDSAQGIDMDLSPDEIVEWAEGHFNDQDFVCDKMFAVVSKWADEIKLEATSHDKIRGAHWEIVNLAAEGHTGWVVALNKIEEVWVQDVVARDKREAGELRREVWRSRTNAFRKVKSRVDQAAQAGTNGAQYTPSECVCVELNAVTQHGLGDNGSSLGIWADGPDGLVTTDESLGPDALGPGGIPPIDALDNVSFGRAQSPEEYEMNDDGNAEHLVDLLKYKTGRIKWAEGYGWIIWTDSRPGRPARWVHDSQNDLMKRAFWRVRDRQVVYANKLLKDWRDALQNNAGQTNPNITLMKEKAKQWANWARKSGNVSQSKNAIEAAKSFPGVSIDINKLNQNPRMLGVSNGVVELTEDGAVLHEAKATDLITFNTNVEWDEWQGVPKYDPGRRLWENYLDQFIPDSRRVDYQTILGHCLVGGNPERIILVLNGGTSTGKSTMLRAIACALGDYASTVNLTIFENHKLNPALANAIPKRVVFTSELSDTDKLSIAVIKRMTGSDPVRAELKGSNVEVQGVPQFVPIMATNTPPEIRGADEALRRRLVVLPFDVKVDEKNDNKQAAFDLEEISSVAILSWLVEGYNNYCRNGLPIGKAAPNGGNKEIEAATNEFASELDHVSEFVKEKIITVRLGDGKTDSPDDGAKVPVSDMHRAYQAWCRDSHVNMREELSAQQLTRRLRGLGMEKKVAKIGGRTVQSFVGVKIRGTGRSAGSSSGVKLTLNTQADMDKKKGK